MGRGAGRQDSPFPRWECFYRRPRSRRERPVPMTQLGSISIAAISARNINKKRKYKINKKIFYKNPIDILKNNKIDILFECVGMADGLSKKIVELALKKKIHLI